MLIWEVWYTIYFLTVSTSARARLMGRESERHFKREGGDQSGK